ncbi:MAG: hypothetical protein WBN81_15245, partial [Gammaproteobacteria bacterium]
IFRYLLLKLRESWLLELGATLEQAILHPVRCPDTRDENDSSHGFGQPSHAVRPTLKLSGHTDNNKTGRPNVVTGAPV